MENIEEKEKKKKECLVELGKQICEVRNSKGLTLEVVSDRGKINISHLSEIENGKINVRLLTLLRIAKQLGCDVAAFSKGIPK